MTTSKQQLSLDLYHDASQIFVARHAAFGTSAGGVMSMGALTILATCVGASPWFALSIVIGTQCIRTLVLWWKSRQAWVVLKLLEADAAKSIENENVMGSTPGDVD